MDVSPGDSGIVRINQNAQFPYPFTSAFESGESVSLEAVPASGYRFDSWGGDLSGTTNPENIVMTCDKNVTANFSRTQLIHTLTILSSGSGSTTPAAGSYVYREGTRVRITAVPQSGWMFDSWIGDVADAASADTRITIYSDKSVTARFLPIQHTLTIQVIGGGSTTPVAGDHSYNEGLVVSIEAAPDKGWQFDGWTGDVAEPSSLSTTVSIRNDKTVIANFSQINTNWWLIASVTTGLLILGVVTWSAMRRRTA